MVENRFWWNREEKICENVLRVLKEKDESWFKNVVVC